MINDLIQRRSLLETELSGKEAELTRIEGELASMEDKHFQAEKIESALENYYAELYKNHPIDRSQEDEIRKTINEKQASIKKTETKRKNEIKKAERNYSSYYFKKQREQAIKTANKAYIEEIKRIFGELEIDIKRFYKKGISKQDLVSLTDIMDGICKTGAKVGTIPLSYQQKVYKWQQTAKELPDDEERINQEKEGQEKQKLLLHFDTQKQDISDIKKNIKSLKQSSTLHQGELDKQKEEQTNLEKRFADEKKKIEDRTADQKAEAQTEFEDAYRIIRERYTKRREEIQTQIPALENSIKTVEEKLSRMNIQKQELMDAYHQIKKEYQDKMDVLQKDIIADRQEIARLKAEQKKQSDIFAEYKRAFNAKLDEVKENLDISRRKQEALNLEKKKTENDAQKTFFLSFGKKRELKEETERITLQISEINKTIQEQESTLEALKKEDPELDKNHPVKEQITEITSQIATAELKLQNDEAKKRTLEKENPEYDDTITLKVELDVLSSQIDQLNGIIDAYRVQYTKLTAENPEKEQEQAILAQKQKYLKKIDEIDNEANSQLAGLQGEKDQIEDSIQKLITKTDKEKKNLVSLQAELKKKETELQETEERLNDFHVDYLIKKYGIKFGSKELTDQKKAEYKEVSLEVKNLRKELAAFDKMITKAEKEQEKQKEEQRKIQIKKAKEDEKARKDQEERQERIRIELEKRDTEQQIIQENVEMLDRLTAAAQALNEDDYRELLNAELCPLRDDNKRMITNSIVRKQYVQKEDSSDCKHYALIFVDQSGHAISEMRLIERKTVGEETKTSFELKSENGFNGEKYYLLMMNFETGNLICAQEYKVNISFSNDFDF